VSETRKRCRGVGSSYRQLRLPELVLTARCNPCGWDSVELGPVVSPPWSCDLLPELGARRRVKRWNMLTMV
jgi:hypothetical protein